MANRHSFFTGTLKVCVLACVLGLLPLAACTKEDAPKEEKPLTAIEKAKKMMKLINHKAKGRLNTYTREKTFKGITIIPVVGTGEIIAVDMRGNSVQVWEIDADRARLLPNGNLLTIHGSKWGANRQPWVDFRKSVWESTWGGELVWDFEAEDVLHHDVQRLPNGNTLLLQRAFVPEEIQAARVFDDDRKLKPIRGDSVLEVTPDKKVVYQWYAHDHLDINYCGLRPCAQVEGGESDEFLDWTHVNTAQAIPENKWFDQGDTRFRPGNIIILPRNWWSAMIIDRETGEIVWKYRGTYRGGMSGGHEAHMIEKGLPGAGNVLILDNGTVTHKGESIAIEVDPTTEEVVWKYENGTRFFTKSRGAVQRLPNGNTLISDDRNGRVFEVTKHGEVVWDFKMNYPINRAKRYPMSYCKTCFH